MLSLDSKQTTLTFEPNIFRDWSSLYSWFGHDMFIHGFRQALGWGYTDVPFAWDGSRVTLYRATEEHVRGFFNVIIKRINEDPKFITTVAEKVVAEVAGLQPFLASATPAELQKLTNEELIAKLTKLEESVITITPWFLILMYFPQQLEILGEVDRYRNDFDKAVTARGQVDKTLAPPSNAAAVALATEVLRRSGLPVADARFLVPKEFQQLLRDNLEPSIRDGIRASLEKRRTGWLITNEGISTQSIANFIASHGWELKLPENVIAETLFGQPSYRAPEVTGIARIIMNQREIDKIQEGDILVAPMTTPEYGPVFGKIKAIVTDEGGITCHAAIISRELKLPTIVGTKVASQTIRNGDIVAVDTERGAVKIIKRATS